MASEVTISNMALSILGADAVVASIDPPDGSVEAGHCARFISTARAAMLEQGSWSFSKKRKVLSLLTDNPSDVWTYAYQVPSDCISARRVLTEVVQTTGLIYDQVVTETNERDSAPFEIEGTTLFTDKEDAVLLYIQDVTDTGKFSPSFVIAFATMLASFLAGPIVKGAEGRKLAAALRDEARGLALSSAATDANQSASANEYLPDAIAARR